MTSLADKALDIATKWHTDQKRKFINTPYIWHPMDVVERLKSWGINKDPILAAAYMHDLLEDTDIDENDIKKLFGNAVLNHIKDLTHQNELQSKRKWLKEIADKADDYVVVIKIADRMDNVYDFIRSEKMEQAINYWRDTQPLIKRIKSDVHLDRKIINNVLESVKELEMNLNVQRQANNIMGIKK